MNRTELIAKTARDFHAALHFQPVTCPPGDSLVTLPPGHWTVGNVFWGQTMPDSTQLLDGETLIAIRDSGADLWGDDVFNDASGSVLPPVITIRNNSGTPFTIWAA